ENFVFVFPTDAPSPRPSPRVRGRETFWTRLEPRVPLTLHPGLYYFAPNGALYKRPLPTRTPGNQSHQLITFHSRTPFRRVQGAGERRRRCRAIRCRPWSCFKLVCAKSKILLSFSPRPSPQPSLRVRGERKPLNLTRFRWRHRR